MVMVGGGGSSSKYYYLLLSTISKFQLVYCGNGKWRERRLTDCKEMNGGRPNIWNHTGSYVEEGIFQALLTWKKSRPNLVERK
jgi:hypothetical protein